MSKTIAPYSTSIYWEDTDASGIVYHANYVRFLERARSEWARALGINQETLRNKERKALVIANLEIDFKRPAKLDDKITVTTDLITLKKASFIVEQKIFRDTTLLVKAHVRLGFIDIDSGRPLALGDDLLAAFTPYLTEEPTP